VESPDGFVDGKGHTAAPSQDVVSPGAIGAYAGGGLGAFISNAGSASALGGHFATYTVDTPVVSVQRIRSLVPRSGPALVPRRIKCQRSESCWYAPRLVLSDGAIF
jgi:hypothetical protein